MVSTISTGEAKKVSFCSRLEGIPPHRFVSRECTSMRDDRQGVTKSTSPSTRKVLLSPSPTYLSATGITSQLHLLRRRTIGRLVTGKKHVAKRCGRRRRCSVSNQYDSRLHICTVLNTRLTETGIAEYGIPYRWRGRAGLRENKPSYLV